MVLLSFYSCVGDSSTTDAKRSISNPNFSNAEMRIEFRIYIFTNCQCLHAPGIH